MVQDLRAAAALRCSTLSARRNCSDSFRTRYRNKRQQMIAGLEGSEGKMGNAFTHHGVISILVQLHHTDWR